MLNILKIKKKENLVRSKNESGELHGNVKDTIPANKEWFNSIYLFNKNGLKILPVADNVLSYILNSYFNMYYGIIEKAKSRRMDIRARKRSTRKIWVSKPEIKHTSNKLIITTYIYNRQYNYLTHRFFKINKIKNVINNRSFINKYYLPKNISKILYKINTLNNIFSKILSINHYGNNKLKGFNLLIKYTKNLLDHEINYLRFKQVLLFNKYKFNNFILHIKKMFQKLYKKNVEFNFINLKNFHLNSNILSQILTKKIRKKKNRAVKVIKASLRMIRTPIQNERTIKREDNNLIEMQNLIVSDLMKSNKDYLNLISSEGIKWFKNIDLEDAVLNSTKYKLVNGLKLQASGRITRRIIAEKARYSIRSIGTLKNVNTSYKGLSSVMVRGYKKYNIDSTLLGSTTHVGAFGLKGWVSSY